MLDHERMDSTVRGKQTQKGVIMSKQQFKKAMKHHQQQYQWFGVPTKEAKKLAWKAVKHEDKAFKKLQAINLRNYAIT